MAKNSFIIPESFLKQLDEFSNGGYFLVTISDAGDPVIHCNFDTSIQALAIQKYISQWSNTVEDLQAENIRENMLTSEGEEFFEEDDDEDDEENEDDL